MVIFLFYETVVVDVDWSPSNECSEEILVSLIFMERVDEVHSGGVVPCGLS